jgi:hypothetical protein
MVKETLLSLFILLLFLFPAVQISERLVAIDKTDERIQDQIALVQLQRIMFLTYDLECEGHCLSFRYNGDDCKLYPINGHLILTPGVQIFFQDFDDLYFRQEGDSIYAIIEREDEINEYKII